MPDHQPAVPHRPPGAQAPRPTGALADAVTDRAIAVQLSRHSDLDDRMAVGLALHRAARVLEADG